MPYMPALLSKTAFLFALICSHVSAGAIASPVNANDIIIDLASDDLLVGVNVLYHKFKKRHSKSISI